MWNEEIDKLKAEISSRRGAGKDLSITSLPYLDDSVWGIQKEKLCIIAARPSQGKSACIRQITLDMVRAQKNVMVFAWEETKSGFLQNMACLYGLSNNFDMVTGHLKAEHEKALEGLKRILANNNLAIMETRGKTVDDFTRLVQKPHQLDCVVVDYLQLIKKGSYRDSKMAYDEFIENARCLAKDRYFNLSKQEKIEKGLDPTKRYPCAMIIASQINRSTVQNKQVTPPLMNEIKGTGVAEEHADLVFLLHWDWFYNRDDPSKKNDYSIIVAKNKQTGKTFLHNCYFYPEFFKISEVMLDGKHKEYTL